jgi:hypothetical protein
MPGSESFPRSEPHDCVRGRVPRRIAALGRCALPCNRRGPSKAAASFGLRLGRDVLKAGGARPHNDGLVSVCLMSPRSRTPRSPARVAASWRPKPCRRTPACSFTSARDAACCCAPDPGIAAYSVRSGRYRVRRSKKVEGRTAAACQAECKVRCSCGLRSEVGILRDGLAGCLSPDRLSRHEAPQPCAARNAG